ncbi:glucose 1-dehydrogenase [Rhizodiscina lignyota]|uniref:Glucose 1-dehydrogenase n=1 Tax=Rhizodiscina lignyota TaxID=1504668 RepID=A0A9P4I4R8_9PEZI|nr:glucose 1-dehydrogenase [Rhizodiscina lignyota]
MPKRVLVGYGIDVDAVSGWINTQNGSPANPTDVSRGIFGATVGIDRLLKLWDKYKIKTTWFVPAHSIESFPSQLAKVRDAGHEIGLHGYTHEFVSTLNEQQQRDVLAKSIKVITDFTGQKPRGWTAPAWSTSKETISLLQEFGIEYDHSFMHHDCQMYNVPDLSEKWVETDVSKPASEWMTPMTALKASSVVEVPANWHLDEDWPPMQLSLKQASTHGYVDPHVIESMWKEQFEFFYREYDTFVFPMSIHPQVSGKPQVILMHERIIDWINSHEGVEWCTMEQMVAEFKSGKFQGAEVTGGAPAS